MVTLDQSHYRLSSEQPMVMAVGNSLMSTRIKRRISITRITNIVKLPTKYTQALQLKYPNYARTYSGKRKA